MKEKFFQNSPHFIQNILISLFNFLAYKKRYGGKYLQYLKQYKANNNLTLDELNKIQLNKLKDLLNYASTNSVFYKKLYHTIDLSSISSIQDLKLLPIVDKELLRTNCLEVQTIPKRDGVVSKTGGTTGKSLEVVFTTNDMQDRFAMLDNFRNKFGYKLGKRTAWFSGKNLINKTDLAKNRFWKTDYYYKVNYYSTFHIKEQFLKYYIENLILFKPEYIVGFPSSILEIANYGLKHNISFPKKMVKAIFPTAEMITAEMNNIEIFFDCKMYDQYASSEGAPFIFECENEKLHLELQSGVFEVLDNNNNPINKGNLIVTSFTTYGTPLIRYNIGDSIELSDEICNCGNNNPLVKAIHGRIDDFIFSLENGKINLGNISNTLKDTKGIIKFQAVQDDIDEVKILLVKDNSIYNDQIESIFIKNWRDRIGGKMKIELEYVSDIPTEKSGKYRMVKNNIKHLI